MVLLKDPKLREMNPDWINAGGLAKKQLLWLSSCAQLCAVVFDGQFLAARVICGGHGRCKGDTWIVTFVLVTLRRLLERKDRRSLYWLLNLKGECAQWYGLNGVVMLRLWVVKNFTIYYMPNACERQRVCA